MGSDKDENFVGVSFNDLKLAEFFSDDEVN
jgi:hypothetical protein